jgi:O-antigen/teichoic acid export membrane protein
MYGAWFSVLGLVITLIINVIFVPIFSYIASAWAAFACYLVMMLVSYYFGQKHMPIKYDLKTIGLYTLISAVLFIANTYVETPYPVINFSVKTILLLIFVLFIIKRDFPVSKIPFLNKLLKS